MPRHRFNSKQKRYLGENLHYSETTRIKVNPDGVSKEMISDEMQERPQWEASETNLDGRGVPASATNNT